MKINFFFLIFLSGLLACNPAKKSNTQHATFEIYETIDVKDMPDNVSTLLDSFHIHKETNPGQPIIGYVTEPEFTALRSSIRNTNIKLLKTAKTVDADNLYFALVTVKPIPEIVNADIKKTKNIGKNVEIRFTMTGAKKWSTLIEKNIGRTIAFAINDQIFTTPLVNGKINNGSALINGIDDESKAKEISELLNSDISN